jgi:hypothetical protein
LWAGRCGLAGGRRCGYGRLLACRTLGVRRICCTTCTPCTLQSRFPSRSDRGDDAVDRYRFSFLDGDVEQRAGHRRGDLGVDLVRRYFEEWLVAIDGIADLLDPSNDGAFGDRLAHLWHHYGCRHINSRLSALRRESPHRARHVQLPRPPRTWSGARVWS